MKSIYENLGGTYTLEADGMLYPNLTLEPREQHPIGKWGRLHLNYLEKEHPGFYEQFILTGTLYKHLEDAEDRAVAMMEQVTRQMAVAAGITEHLKSTDQMEWVRKIRKL